jgi:hypothetical protein
MQIAMHIGEQGEFHVVDAMEKLSSGKRRVQFCDRVDRRRPFL